MRCCHIRTNAAKASVEKEIQQLYLMKSYSRIEADCCKLADILVDLVSVPHSSRLLHCTTATRLTLNVTRIAVG